MHLPIFSGKEVQRLEPCCDVLTVPQLVGSCTCIRWKFLRNTQFLSLLVCCSNSDKNQVLAIHISQTTSKTDQQRALVSPRMGKSHVFGYPVTNGLEKLLGEALSRKGHCAEGSWNQVFSTFFIPFAVAATDPC